MELQVRLAVGAPTRAQLISFLLPKHSGLMLGRSSPPFSLPLIRARIVRTGRNPLGTQRRVREWIQNKKKLVSELLLCLVCKSGGEKPDSPFPGGVASVPNQAHAATVTIVTPLFVGQDFFPFVTYHQWLYIVCTNATSWTRLAVAKECCTILAIEGDRLYKWDPTTRQVRASGRRYRWVCGQCFPLIREPVATKKSQACNYTQ